MGLGTRLHYIILIFIILCGSRSRRDKSKSNICRETMISLAFMSLFFYSPTYFVEYQFPAAVFHQPGARAARAAGVGRRRNLLPGSHEFMRIASKKMKDGGM